MSANDPADLPPTARRILAAAQDILAERGYAELTSRGTCPARHR